MNTTQSTIMIQTFKKENRMKNAMQVMKCLGTGSPGNIAETWFLVCLNLRVSVEQAAEAHRLEMSKSIGGTRPRATSREPEPQACISC